MLVLQFENMKYRRLRTDELADLETEFVRFLAVQSIPADDWEKMKDTDLDKVNLLLDKFSEVVYEKVLANIEYLEFRTPKDIKTFFCPKDKIYLIGLKIEGDSNLDFTKNLSPEEMMTKMRASKAKLQLYRAEKDYKPERDIELFRMLEAGALIDKTGGMYKILEEMVKGQSNPSDN